MKRLLVLAPVLAVLVILAGCGGGDEGHNAQDVSFLKDMVPHHEQAVVMSDLALSQAGSPAVKDLATRIKAAQGPEITEMKEWLAAWGEGGPTEGGHDMSAMGDMKGMASESDLDALRGASGAAFDRLYLKDMIAHHEGAVDMATSEIAKGRDMGAKTLAQQIATSQEQEIEEMERLLAQVAA